MKESSGMGRAGKKKSVYATVKGILSRNLAKRTEKLALVVLTFPILIDCQSLRQPFLTGIKVVRS